MPASVRTFLAAVATCVCAASNAGLLTPAEAVRLVSEKLTVVQFYPDEPECLAFGETSADSEFVEVAVIEVHDQRCGGDPAISHRRDSFKVNRVTKGVFYYDIIGDRDIPLEEALQNARRK